MRQVVRIQNCHRHSYGNSVVAAQRGSLCQNQIAVHRQIQPLFRHILGTLGNLFADHIQMALQDHRLRLFISGGRFLDDDDIVCRVLMILKATRLCKVRAPVTNRLRVSGAVGNGAHLLKKLEDLLRLQLVQNCHKNYLSFLFAQGRRWPHQRRKSRAGGIGQTFLSLLTAHRLMR
ncbi:hypothetical protein DSECCO2_395900 [anaerobic digester metagenome]